MVYAHINICCAHIFTYKFVCTYFVTMVCAHIYVRSREAISSSGPSMGGLNRPQEGVPLSDKRLFFVFEKCWFSVPIFVLHSDCNLVTVSYPFGIFFSYSDASQPLKVIMDAKINSHIFGKSKKKWKLLAIIFSRIRLLTKARAIRKSRGC